MRQSSLIALNAVIMWAARALQLFPQLYLVPYLIKKIGNEGYGIYALVWSLLLSLETLQRSLQSGVVKYSAAFLARNEMDAVNKTVSSSFVFSCILAMVLGGLLLGITLYYQGISQELKHPLIISSILVFLLIPMTPYVAVIQAKQYYYIGALTETSFKYMGLFTILLAFKFFTPSVMVLIATMGLMLFFSRLVQMFISYQILPGLQNRVTLFDKNNFQLILRFGSTIVLASACLTANTTGIRWLMNELVSPSFVAHLVIMVMPSILLTQIVGPLAVTIMPATSSYEAVGNQSVLQDILTQGVRYVSVLVFAGLIAVFFLIGPVLKLWVGPDYIFLAPYATAIFAGTCFRESTSIAHHMLKGLGHLQTVFKIYFICLVIIPAGLILFLYKLHSNPYLAVTLGLTIGNVACGFFQISACSKLVEINHTKLLVQAHLLTIITALAPSLLLMSVIKLCSFDGANGFVILFATIIAIIIFLIAWFKFISNEDDKQFFSRILTNLTQIKQRFNC